MSIKTFFASPERASDQEIARTVQTVAQSPLVQEILRDVGGMIGVLDGHRQIVAINDQAMKAAGISRSEEILGLRPGEALGCVHASDGPSGCGTGMFCRTCGAVLAIMAAQERHEPVEQECVLTVKSKEGTRDVDLKVRASPLTFADQPFVLLFLQDVSAAKRREALERSFFHDLGNAVMGVSGLAEMLAYEKTAARKDETTVLLNQAVTRLVDEIRVQRILLAEDIAHGHLRLDEFPVEDVIQDVRAMLAHHPAAKNRKIEIAEHFPARTVRSDKALLGRVLGNMLINACEATGEHGAIRMRVECSTDEISFLVWNSSCIPEDIAPRIFQRYFSTKEGLGRGLGTYGMKLIGESYLGGRVSFTTSPAAGTTFRLSLPVSGQKPDEAAPPAA